MSYCYRGRHTGVLYHQKRQSSRSMHALHSEAAFLSAPSVFYRIFDSFFGGGMLESFVMFDAPGFNIVGSSSTNNFGGFGSGARGDFRFLSTSPRKDNVQEVRMMKFAENGQETITEEMGDLSRGLCPWWGYCASNATVLPAYLQSHIRQALKVFVEHKSEYLHLQVYLHPYSGEQALVLFLMVFIDRRLAAQNYLQMRLPIHATCLISIVWHFMELNSKFPFRLMASDWPFRVPSVKKSEIHHILLTVRLPGFFCSFLLQVALTLAFLEWSPVSTFPTGGVITRAIFF